MSENQVEASEIQLTINLGDNKNLRVTRIEIVGDLYDDVGIKLGDGNNAISLNSSESASLDIQNFVPISAKF